jgi:hypothetical protein
MASKSPILILKSYVINSRLIRGSFPIYIKGISQCCITPDNKQVITPVIVPAR